MLGVRSTIGALRGLVSTRNRIALVLATLLLGAGVAFALAFFLPPDQRTFAGIVPLAQLIVSVLTPFSAALLTHDLRDPDGNYRSRTAEALRGRWIASGLYGLVIGGYVAASVGVAVAVAPATDPWAAAGPAVVGSLLVQLIPVGVGSAAGLLIPGAARACLATVVVPLGLTLLVGVIGLSGLAGWITPLGAAGHLVPGPMSPLSWAQWLVTAALWVVLPNALGLRLLRARAAAYDPTAEK